MKKLLILAYDFPPYVSVGGLRPYNWFKYLKEFNIDPIVVTRQWQNHYGNQLDYISAGYSKNIIVEKNKYGTILRTSYKPNLSNKLLLKYGDKKFKLIRKMVSGFYEIMQFLYPIGPKSELYVVARNYIKEHKVDAIIATGDPFVLFAYAAQLSSEFNIPWIADYRDPWSQNIGVKKNTIINFFDLIFEKKYVKTAHSITTVDDLFRLKINYNFPNNIINIIPNGFDPDTTTSIQNRKQNNKLLSFAIAGTIYLWHPLEVVLDTFNKYAEKNKNLDFRLNFIGTNVEELINQLINNKYKNLIGKVHIEKKIINADFIKKLAVNNILILFNYYEFTGTKIYDYLAVKRKILLCFENDPIANELKRKYYLNKTEEALTQPQINILNSTNSGVVVKDAQHLMIVLKELSNEFQNTSMIKCESVGIEKYSRKIQVEKLAELINSI